MSNIREAIARYLHGWSVWYWVMHKMLTKKHGAGPAQLWIALAGAGCARWLIDGQHRRGQPPRFARRALATMKARKG